nr:MAG TPA: hypothetical protein [Caudoviricetes sp.]
MQTSRDVGKLASSGVITRPTKTLNCWKLLKLRVPLRRRK